MALPSPPPAALRESENGGTKSGTDAFAGGRVGAGVRGETGEPADLRRVNENELDPDLLALLAMVQEVPRGQRWKCITIHRKLLSRGYALSRHAAKHGLVQLAKRGFVNSQRGTGGGYCPVWDRVEVA